MFFHKLEKCLLLHFSSEFWEKEKEPCFIFIMIFLEIRITFNDIISPKLYKNYSKIYFLFKIFFSEGLLNKFKERKHKLELYKLILLRKTNFVCINKFVWLTNVVLSSKIFVLFIEMHVLSTFSLAAFFIFEFNRNLYCDNRKNNNLSSKYSEKKDIKSFRANVPSKQFLKLFLTLNNFIHMEW